MTQIGPRPVPTVGYLRLDAALTGAVGEAAALPPLERARATAALRQQARRLAGEAEELHLEAVAGLVGELGAAPAAKALDMDEDSVEGAVAAVAQEDRPRPNGARDRLALALFATGATLDEVAQRMRVSPQLVRQALVAGNVDPGSPDQRPTEE